MTSDNASPSTQPHPSSRKQRTILRRFRHRLPLHRRRWYGPLPSPRHQPSTNHTPDLTGYTCPKGDVHAALSDTVGSNGESEQVCQFSGHAWDPFSSLCYGPIYMSCYEGYAATLDTNGIHYDTPHGRFDFPQGQAEGTGPSGEHRCRHHVVEYC